MKLNIKPKDYQEQGIAVALDWSISSYERNSDALQVSYQLLAEDNSIVKKGIETLEKNVVDNWGSDNTAIDDALIAIHNLEKEL